MEVGLGEWSLINKLRHSQVLILVLMEVGLGGIEGYDTKLIESSLNPCFNGSRSRRRCPPLSGW